MKIEWRSSAARGRAARRLLRHEIWETRGEMARASLVSGASIVVCFLLAGRILPGLGPPWLLSLALCALMPALLLLGMLATTLLPLQVRYVATYEGIRIAGGDTRFVGWNDISAWNLEPDLLVAGETCLLLATRRGVRGHALPDGPDRERLLELIGGRVLRDEALTLPPARQAPVFSDWLYPWTLAAGVALGLAVAAQLRQLADHLPLVALTVLLAGPGTLAALALPAMRRWPFAAWGGAALLLNILALWMAYWIFILQAIRELAGVTAGDVAP